MKLDPSQIAKAAKLAKTEEIKETRRAIGAPVTYAMPVRRGGRRKAAIVRSGDDKDLQIDFAFSRVGRRPNPRGM
jgi:hypothetical protein